MAKQLANGTLSSILQQMPRGLRRQLAAKIQAEDQRRQSIVKTGESKIVTLSNHLRWFIEHNPDLGNMKVALFVILRQYVPLTLDDMNTNTLPPLSECAQLWAKLLGELEFETLQES